MKNKFTMAFLFGLFTITCNQSIAQDLPLPLANYRNLPAGSLVISMDNTTQANSANFFNLRAYGLVVLLLNNNMKVKWIIQSGKVKDGVDFSVMANMVKPTVGGATSYNFKSGPFVISAEDTAGVSILIDNFNNSVTKLGDKVKVYQTLNDATVDQRYDLTGFKPKAALLNNGGNWTIHRDYVLAAGINFGVNSANTSATNWSQAVASDLMNSCYTFASEGHWQETNGIIARPVINNIRTFLMAGGNVLAECAAVRTYENVGKFHSTGGIDVTTENSFSGLLSTLVYDNADLSYTQFDGAININKGGSLKNWTYSGSIQNNEHNHVKGPSLLANIGASVGKLSTTGNGGLLFYLGNHKFDRTDDITVLNGIRMYLNAFLTPPANNNTVCLSIGNNDSGNNGAACFSSSTKSNINARSVWTFDNAKQTYTIRTTLSREFADNTYGTSTIGWGTTGHKFTDLISGDFLQMALFDKAGAKKMEMKIDYLSASKDVTSGYRSLGVSGGDGKMISGKSTDVVRVKTSLDYNLNDFGYVLTTNSPLTNNIYSSNSQFPNWIYDVWYEVEVKASAFGTIGFATPSITSLTSSPSKTSVSTELVSLSDCLPLVDRIAANPITSSINDDLNIYPMPAKDYFNISINSIKEKMQSIQILDAVGKPVASKQFHVLPGKNVFNINTSNIAGGSYFVRIVDDNKVLNKKIMILK